MPLFRVTVQGDMIVDANSAEEAEELAYETPDLFNMGVQAVVECADEECDE